MLLAGSSGLNVINEFPSESFGADATHRWRDGAVAERVRRALGVGVIGELALSPRQSRF
jgi:hypothetical protein